MSIFWKKRGYREHIDMQIPEVLVGKKVACMSLERSRTHSNKVTEFLLFLSLGANIAS